MQHELVLLRTELLKLKAASLAIALDRAMARIAAGLKAYDPAQPRVPAGDPDGGQWVGGGQRLPVLLAANDGTPGNNAAQKGKSTILFDC